MDMPGVAQALNDPHLRSRAEKQAEELMDELKKSVKADFEDVGVLRKQMQVTVPAKVIADHISQNYDDLMHDAIVPGFRKGRAPRELVERRFGSEVRESLKTSIVGQSFMAAIENAELEVLGDPLFRVDAKEGPKFVDLTEAMEKVQLPANADLTYTCEIEIKPSFELPKLERVKIKKPRIQITDAMIDEQIQRQQKLRGRFEPQPDAKASEGDMLIADVTLSSEGKEVKSEENVSLGVRAARLDGIPLNDLGEALAGAKIGDTRTLDCTIPEDYERPDLRGKPGRFEFKIQDLKRLVPISRADFMAQMGYADEDELNKSTRDDMEAEVDEMVERASREQVYDYLLENTKLDVPPGLSARQTDRAVVRRVIELQQQGVPESEIDARIDELRTSAKENVARDLKLGFILDKVSKQLDVDVTDEEVNTEIARIARRYNRRFDRVRDDLQAQGLLTQLAEQIRHDKCLQQILAKAEMVEVTEESAPPKKAAPAKAKATAKPKAESKKVDEEDEKPAKKSAKKVESKKPEPKRAEPKKAPKKSK